MSRGIILCVVALFFITSAAYAEVVMQVGNSTLGTGEATSSPFMTNKKGDRIIKIFSHKKEQTNTSQELDPVIQVYPQVDLRPPRPPQNPPRHHGDHRVK